MVYIILNLVVMFMNLIDNSESLEEQRAIAAISGFFLWLKVIEWLRLFEGTAFFISLIYKTLVSIQYFMVIMIIIYMMFGTGIYFLSLGIPEENEIMPSYFSFWPLDTFQSQYEHSLGEFQLEAYGEADKKRVLMVVFILATFVVMIVFLNMLIAIMGDAFDQATENKENNRKLGMLKIMGDYVNLTLQGGDRQRAHEYKEHCPEEEVSHRGQVWNVDGGISEKKYFYVVVPHVEGTNEEGVWEGSIKALKKFIDSRAASSESKLDKKIESLAEEQKKSKEALQTKLEAKLEALNKNQD